MDNESARRNKLYREFCQEVKKGTIVFRFDEDELLDIYDFAQDQYDEYTQLEVLFSAARVCPDSEQFALRRAYFYQESLNMSDGMETISLSGAYSGPSWDLIPYYTGIIELDRKVVSDFLNTYKELDDETVLHMVDVFTERGHYDLLKEFKKDIIKRCVYPQTFLYELAHEADDRQDYGFAIEQFEELTMMEPFNSHYWHMLAQMYIRVDDWDNAANAIDYALAIEPDSNELKYTRAQVYYDSRTDSDKAYEIIRSIVDSDPENVMARHTLAAMLALDGRENEAYEVIYKLFKENMNDRATIDISLKLCTRDHVLALLSEYFDAYKEWNDATVAEEWISWARSYYEQNDFIHCSTILLAIESAFDEFSAKELFLTSLYRSADYEIIDRLYTKYETKDVFNSIELYLVLLAYLRLDNHDRALKVARRFSYESENGNEQVPVRIMNKGLGIMVPVIEEALVNNFTLDYNLIDPFVS